MFALNTGWPIGPSASSEDRDRFHRIALQEARVATELHPEPASHAPTLIERVIAAIRREPADRTSAEPNSIACAA